MNLRKEQRIILASLDEDDGWTTGQIAKKSKAFERLGGRIASSWVRNDLLKMKAAGLVREMDDQKPVCWVRTKAGTEVLTAEMA
jgi:hypothetical protein